MELAGDDTSKSLQRKWRVNERKRKRKVAKPFHLGSKWDHASCMASSANHAERRVLVGERAKYERLTTCDQKPSSRWPETLYIYAVRQTHLARVYSSTTAYGD